MMMIQQPNDSNSVEPEISDQTTPLSFSNKVKLQLDKILQPWEGNRKCKRMFRSEQAIQDEKRRQVIENRFIIHPYSIFRWYWDLIMLVVLVFTLFTLPLEVAFFTKDVYPTFTLIHSITDIAFVTDIVFNFRTGYLKEETSQIVLGSKRIVKHYFLTWFFIDAISSIPIDVIYLVTHGHKMRDLGSKEDLLITLRTLRFAKLLRLLRIFRVARLVRYVHKLSEFFMIDSKKMNIINLLMVTAVFCHWNSCVQYLSAYLVTFPDHDPNSWIVVDHIHYQNTSFFEKYTRCLWRAMSHMMSIGYGTTPPMGGLVETWMVTISMVIGAAFYALFVAHMSSLIMTLDLSGRKYDEMLSEVRQYMRFRHVPIHLQKMVVEYFDHKYQRKYFDEFSILNDSCMSLPLRQSIVMHNCRNLVEKVPFLAKAPKDFIFDIICRLQFQVFFPGDRIIKAGDRGKCMYFLEHGSVSIELPSGTVVNKLGDGTYFGEIALLLEQKRVASVIALEICDVYLLTKSDFDLVLTDYPKMKDVLETKAIERLAQIRKRSLADVDAPDEQETEFEIWAASLNTQTADRPKHVTFATDNS